MNLIFEWDALKSQTNLKKHKVSFEEAKTLFCDPFLLTFRDEYHSEMEERYISIGVSARQRTLLVVHTEQNETEEGVVIRIISCRKATPVEKERYEQKDEI